MSKKEILPGIHTVTALLHYQPERANSIWIEQDKANPRIEQLVQQARKFGIAVQSVDRKKLDQWCESTQHQGIAASCAATNWADEQDLLDQCTEPATPPLYLILDSISDPHNWAPAYALRMRPASMPSFYRNATVHR